METIITFNSHLRISKENFKKIESIFHPRIRKNIRQFERKDLGNTIYYSFPYFHGCRKLNKNKLNKRINYRIGEMCKSPSSKISFKNIIELNENHLTKKIYFTRYGTNFGINKFAICKNKKWFNWDKKQFFEKKYWMKSFEKTGYKPLINIKRHIIKTTLDN